MYQIPITNQPNQSFTCTIPLGDANIVLEFFATWNAIAEYWVLSITDTFTNENLIDSLPLVVGDAPAQNVLGQWAYLGIGSAYVVPITADAPDRPGEDGWNVTHILLWGE